MQPCLITKTFIAEDNDWPLKRAFKDGGKGTYTATYSILVIWITRH